MQGERDYQPDPPGVNSEDVATQATESFAWTNRKIAACAVSAGLILSAPFVVSELGEDHSERSPNYSAAQTPGDRQLPTYMEEQCPDVPESFVEKAESMLRAPENPKVSRAVERGMSTGMGGNLMHPYGPHDIQRMISNRSKVWSQPQVRHPVAKEVADDLNLTVFDYRTHSQRLQASVPTDRMGALRQSQKFLKNYDVTIRFASEKDGFPVAKPIGSKTIEDYIHVNDALENITGTIANYPKEYIALSGIKHIVLANEVESGHENDVFSRAMAVTDGRTIWFDVGYERRGSIVAHEIGHGVMRALCGGSAATTNDPQLAEGMQGKDAYDAEYVGMSYQSYANDLIKIEKRMLEGQEYKARLKDLQKQAKEISTTSMYAHTKVEEDGAETLSALTADELHSMRHAMAMPKLRRKLSVVLGRMLYYRPHIAEYFMQTSLKYKKTSSPLDAIMEDELADKR